MRKGISPLIAAVILIAFVVGVAGIASGFFSGFLKQRTGEVGESGRRTVECSVANFDVDTQGVFDDGMNITVTVKGETSLGNWTFTAFYEDGHSESGTVSQDLSPGESHTFDLVQTSPTITSGNIYRVRIGTRDCPEKTATINETTTGRWEVIY